VLLGLVMVDGVPIAHHLFAGNRRDASTVPAVLDDLERRFGLGRVVFVGDRGMVTEAILQLLRARGQGYLVGRNRRRAPAIIHCIEQATGPWLECPRAPQTRTHAQPPRTLVQEVAAPEPGLRTFVVHSDERLAFERQERRKAMARVRRELAALQQRVAAGRLKAPEKVGAAAARSLARNHGHRYYDWTYQDGVFRYFEHPLHLPREQALEGKYVIQTEEPALSPVQAVQLYKELSGVEAAFRGLKDVIELRPVDHQTDRRVAAHIFVATLALLLECVLQRKLRAAGLDLSAAEALHTLNTVRFVSFATGDGRTRSGVTRGTPRAAAVLRALAITQLDPPASPTEGRTRT
jgi:transposase